MNRSVSKRPGAAASEKRSSAQAPSVATGWTRRIAAEGVTPVSNHFLAHYSRMSLTHGEAILVIHIMSLKSDDEAPWPSLKSVASFMNISSAQVRKLVRSLESKGVLRREFRSGEASLYHFAPLFRRLEETIDFADRPKSKRRRRQENG